MEEKVVVSVEAADPRVSEVRPRKIADNAVVYVSVLIAGNNGSSGWVDGICAKSRKDAIERAACNAIMRRFDPNNKFLICGRTRRRGITKITIIPAGMAQNKKTGVCRNASRPIAAAQACVEALCLHGCIVQNNVPRSVGF